MKNIIEAIDKTDDKNFEKQYKPKASPYTHLLKRDDNKPSKNDVDKTDDKIFEKQYNNDMGKKDKSVDEKISDFVKEYKTPLIATGATAAATGLGYLAYKKLKKNKKTNKN